MAPTGQETISRSYDSPDGPRGHERKTIKHVLELNQVSRQFGSEPAVYALVDVDLRLEPGEVWSRVLAHEILHVYGAIHVPPEIAVAS